MKSELLKRYNEDSNSAREWLHKLITEDSDEKFSDVIKTAYHASNLRLFMVPNSSNAELWLDFYKAFIEEYSKKTDEDPEFCLNPNILFPVYKITESIT